jgi:hypothetical protein
MSDHARNAPNRRAFRQWRPLPDSSRNERTLRVVFEGTPATCAWPAETRDRRFPGKKDPSMNRLLIGILDILNKLLAVALVVSSTVSGFYGQFGAYGVAVDDPLHRALATLIGFVIGVVLAALLSGFLATIINISREMTTIRELLRERPLVMR